LEWLDSDRSSAAEKYEMIRQSLIQIFIWKRCSEAESLADETLDRVMSNVPELRKTYVGSPTAYIHSVAKNLLREKTEPPNVQFETLAPETPATAEIENEKMNGCLERCLSNLSPYSRDLILGYYDKEHAQKVSHRIDLAARLGICDYVMELLSESERTKLESGLLRTARAQHRVKLIRLLHQQSNPAMAVKKRSPYPLLMRHFRWQRSLSARLTLAAGVG
jgi:hypothetical protein